MVFNGAVVVGVARLSADLWQHVAYNPQRLSSREVLDMLCCLPLHHLRRLALCLFSFCFPTAAPPDRRYAYYYDSDDSDSDYDSHSD